MTTKTGRTALLLLATLLAPACGSEGPPSLPTRGTPSPSPSSSPSPSPTPASTTTLPAPEGFTYELRPALGRAGARLTWSAVKDATDYEVSLGDTSEASDARRVATAANELVLDDIPLGTTVYARVRARNARDGQRSPELRIKSIDLREAIDAFYFGSGPLIPSDGLVACVDGSRWVAFPSGATVRVRISTTLPPAAQETVRIAAGQWEEATAGDLKVVTELTGEADPQPDGANQITIALHPDPVSQGCGVPRGCTFAKIVDGVIVSARALIGPELQLATSAFGHDAIGHGGLGACHIDGVRIGGARHSIMSAGPGGFSCGVPSDECDAVTLSPLDVEAARAIHAAHMPRGADRATFLKAGLVLPLAAGVLPPTFRAPRIHVSDREEVVIIDND